MEKKNSDSSIHQPTTVRHGTDSSDRRPSLEFAAALNLSAVEAKTNPAAEATAAATEGQSPSLSTSIEIRAVERMTAGGGGKFKLFQWRSSFASWRTIHQT